MNGQIKQMITKYIKLMKMIIKSKRKKGDKTAGVIIPDAWKVKYISYGKIINYKDFIVKLKRVMEGIRVDNGA